MAFAGSYECSKCKRVTKRELLTAKKVMFQEVGLRPQTFKSRIVGWFCPPCVAQDPDWKLEAYNSPGMQTPTPAQGG